MITPFDYQESPHKCFRCTIELAAEPRDGMILLDLPGVCCCMYRRIGSAPELARFEKQQNYAARRAGSDLALEAELKLVSREHPDWTRLRIGIPLSEMGDIRQVELMYNGPRFRLSGGGKVLDEEMPFGDPPGDPPPEMCFLPEPESAPVPQTWTGPLHLWMPDGLNVWAGDAAVGYFNGKFHLFYLYDRRHHASSFSAGSHTWHHMESADLKTWRMDGDIMPHPEQFYSYGTGTPFEWQGRIFLSYGLHTGRYLPADTAPRGGTWCESADGIHFVPSRKIFSRSENPSVFNGSDGELCFFAGENGAEMQLLRCRRFPAEDAELLAVFPLRENTPTGHTSECPAYFSWHGKHYLLVGFSGYYSADTPDFADRRDLAFEERDLYDGLEVPMVAPFAGDRRILAGWVRIDNEWGGTLGLRELVWCSDGVPGIRWLEEALPPCGAWSPLPEDGAVADNVYLKCQCPSGKDVVIRLAGDGEPVEIRIFAGKKKAELVLASVKDYPTTPVFPSRRLPGGRAAAHLRGIDEPYTVRVLIRHDRKLQGSIVDVEIAGLRTLIHHFPGLRARLVTLSPQVTCRTAPITLA